MSYIKFINSCKKGINRDIKSRKLNVKITTYKIFQNLWFVLLNKRVPFF